MRKEENYLIYIKNKLKKYDMDKSIDYKEFYNDYEVDVQNLLSIFHYELNSYFNLINSRIMYKYLHADPSRNFLNFIDEIKEIQEKLKDSRYYFNIVDDYEKEITRCLEVVQEFLGTKIPEDFRRIDVIETQPIFFLNEMQFINRNNNMLYEKMKLIGEGSYANVYKYKDSFYDKFYALKRAKKNISEKEYERFRLEFDTMSKLKSPYTIEVYKFNDEKKEYTMEYVDYTLDSYITKNNNKLKLKDRLNIINQIFKAFIYINSKDNMLHRDISTNNILIKEYESLIVIKVSDFGLVKLKDSKLTSLNTELKGFFNDPKLEVHGFENYNIKHEIYALTRIIYFTMTGKIQINQFTNDCFKEFIERGISDDLSTRFESIEHMKVEFDKIKNNLSNI